MSETLLKLLSLTEMWLGALGLAAFLAIFWVLRGARSARRCRLKTTRTRRAAGIATASSPR